MSTAAGVLLLLGAAFLLISAVGVLRLPDLFMRMHAASKAGTLGVGLVLLAAAMHFGELATGLKAAAVVLFVLLTTPIAAHVLGRVAYHDGVPHWDRSGVDELAGHYALDSDEDAPSGTHGEL